MYDQLLHTGAGHPSLWWVVAPSVLTFVGGVAVGASLDRVRAWLSPEGSATAE